MVQLQNKYTEQTHELYNRNQLYQQHKEQINVMSIKLPPGYFLIDDFELKCQSPDNLENAQNSCIHSFYNGKLPKSYNRGNFC